MNMKYPHFVDLRSIVACLCLLLFPFGIMARNLIDFKTVLNVMTEDGKSFDMNRFVMIIYNSEGVIINFHLEEDNSRQKDSVIIKDVITDESDILYRTSDGELLSLPSQKDKYKFDSVLTWTKFRYTAGEDNYT